MGKIKETMRQLDTGLMKSRAEVPNLYLDPSSPLKCDKCKAHLGLWRMVRKALFKKRGSDYVVRCKSCGADNVRTKGDIGREIDERWKD